MSLPRLLIISALEETVHEELLRELRQGFVVDFMQNLIPNQLRTRLSEQEVEGLILDQSLGQDRMIRLCQAFVSSIPDGKIFELKAQKDRTLLVPTPAVAAIYRENAPDAFEVVGACLGVHSVL